MGSELPRICAVVLQHNDLKRACDASNANASFCAGKVTIQCSEEFKDIQCAIGSVLTVLIIYPGGEASFDCNIPKVVLSDRKSWLFEMDHGVELALCEGVRVHSIVVPASLIGYSP